jgi:hypothetical protein
LIEFANSHLEDLGDLVKKKQEADMKKWRDEQLEANKESIKTALEKWKADELAKAHAEAKEHVEAVKAVSPELKLAAEQAVDKGVDMKDFVA